MTAQKKTTTPDKQTSSENAKQPQQSSAKQIGENTKFSLRITWSAIQHETEHVLERLRESAELPGFRKGKAPKSLVEKQIGRAKILEEAALALLPTEYSKIIKEKNLKPILDPSITPVSMKEGEDWEFQVEIAELPAVNLKDYKDAIAAARAKDALWVPGKDQKEQGTSDDEKLRHILELLLKHTEVAVPELLVRREVNASLSRLVDQLEKLRIPLEDYLKSTGKSIDMLRQEYAASAVASLKLEFVFGKIAQEENIGVSDTEIAKAIETIADPKARKRADTPQQRSQIRASLLRKKTVEFLLGL